MTCNYSVCIAAVSNKLTQYCSSDRYDDEIVSRSQTAFFRWKKAVWLRETNDEIVNVTMH